MSSFGIRPRFSQVLEYGLKDAQERILKEVDACEDCCEVKSFPGYICLRIPEADRHFWSPRLTLALEEPEAGRTRVDGIYGPNANVWGIFLYSYLLIGSVGLFGGCLGLSQKLIGKNPWGLWIFGVALAAAIALYLFAQFGQKLGAIQTFRLHQIYESAMERTVDIH